MSSSTNHDDVAPDGNEGSNEEEEEDEDEDVKVEAGIDYGDAIEGLPQRNDVVNQVEEEEERVGVKREREQEEEQEGDAKDGEDTLAPVKSEDPSIRKIELPTPDVGGEVAKKLKAEGAVLSPVVHIRGLPINTAVAPDRFISLAKPFGPVERVVELRQKGQAFVQLQSGEAAARMVQHYKTSEARIDGRVVLVEISTHTELHGGFVPGVDGQSIVVTSSGVGIPSSFGPSTSTRAPARSVLVKISNQTVPISLDAMYAVFQLKKIEVVRMALFLKDNVLHILVELSNVEQATKAVTELNGQCIYSGCCQMDVSFAKDQAVSVKHNSERMRDFTKDLSFISEGPVPVPVPGGPTARQTPLTSMHLGSYGQGMGGSGASSGIGSSHAGIPGSSGGVGGGGGMNSGMNNGSGAGGGAGPGGFQQQDGRVLMVSNLDEERINLRSLFIIFGCYGDVEKIKIMFDRRSAALIQFTTARGASFALQYLSGVELFGKTMRVTRSTHSEVNVTGPNKETNLAGNYGTNHPMHRFKGPKGEENYSKLSYPCPRVYVSTIPMEMSEESFRMLIRPAGHIEKLFWLKPKQFQCCFVTMSNIQEAFNMILMFHWYKVAITPQGHDVNMRVSFSAERDGASASFEQHQGSMGNNPSYGAGSYPWLNPPRDGQGGAPALPGAMHQMGQRVPQGAPVAIPFYPGYSGGVPPQQGGYLPAQAMVQPQQQQQHQHHHQQQHPHQHSQQHHQQQQQMQLHLQYQQQQQQQAHHHHHQAPPPQQQQYPGYPPRGAPLMATGPVERGSVPLPPLAQPFASQSYAPYGAPLPPLAQQQQPQPSYGAAYPPYGANMPAAAGAPPVMYGGYMQQPQHQQQQQLPQQPPPPPPAQGAMPPYATGYVPSGAPRPHGGYPHAGGYGAPPATTQQPSSNRNGSPSTQSSRGYGSFLK